MLTLGSLFASVKIVLDCAHSPFGRHLNFVGALRSSYDNNTSWRDCYWLDSSNIYPEAGVIRLVDGIAINLPLNPVQGILIVCERGVSYAAAWYKGAGKHYC